MSFVKNLNRDFNFLKLPIMNRIEITNKINHYIFLTKKNCYDFYNQSINYVKMLPGKSKIWARKIKQLLKNEGNPYNYALPREKTSLIFPDKLSESVYLNPYNNEVADFCVEWVKNQNITMFCQYIDNVKFLNIQFAQTIDIDKVVADLKIAVFNRFGK